MTKSYKVSGMTCGGCARSVEGAIKGAIPGASVTIDLPTGRVTVEPADDAKVEKAVAEAGFGFDGAA
ncbi:MAG: heavy-metal-associated domain-containing protein [Alphaproteobacteria bacterium]|nr:heavy-metal-associated domain-containing protein [Alphaproteobacteria bacterium]